MFIFQQTNAFFKLFNLNHWFHICHMSCIHNFKWAKWSKDALSGYILITKIMFEKCNFLNLTKWLCVFPLLRTKCNKLRRRYKTICVIADKDVEGLCNKFKFTLEPRETVLKDRSTLGLNIEDYNQYMKSNCIY